MAQGSALTLGPVRRAVDDFFRHPGRSVVVAFAVLVAVGTLALLLPVSRADGSSVSVGDATFTAVSAVTVTGLVIGDTAVLWSVFGQAVIAALIQLGGLGIMTAAGFLGLAFNRRLGLRSGALAGAEIGVTDAGVLRDLLGSIVRFVAAAELSLAAALSAAFFAAGGRSPLGAVGLGVFHSVSAFNNAGFSTLPGGVEGFTGNWAVCVTLMVGFVLGGIGFPVVFELRRRWRRPRSWSLHSKVTLGVTGVLLAGGAVGVALIEWTSPRTLGGLPFDEKVLASLFQSASTRTAGFNTLPMGELRAATLLLMVPLMVVGAASASTGGGIKVTTLALVVQSTFAEFRGDAHPAAFGRALAPAKQRQALALLVAALGAVGTVGFLLVVAHRSLPPLDLLFEAASAFGTVGLSTGITPELDGFARLLVMATMFIGRIGPHTFGTAVLVRSRRQRFDFATEDVLVG